jgi:hypothetical protein
MSPDYSRDRGMPSSKAFLVTNDSFTIGENFVLELDTPQRVQSDLWFYLVGYADYVDAFGDRYRSEYARRYEPAQDKGPKEMRNNLVSPTSVYASAAPGFRFSKHHTSTSESLVLNRLPNQDWSAPLR